MSKVVMMHEKDPKKAILNELGTSVKDMELMNTQVLVAVYIRPEKTKGGVIVPDRARDEDRFQSKVGLILKAGPSAFVDETGKWFGGTTFKEGDWVVFRPSDGWSVTINGISCRMLEDTSIKARISHPDAVW
jgi:co-chaperonin GroES (HSP10)